MDPPDLARAAELYEQLGRSCMEKKLLQMNAKGYWLQAGLCLLGELFWLFWLSRMSLSMMLVLLSWWLLLLLLFWLLCFFSC